MKEIAYVVLMALAMTSIGAESPKLSDAEKAGKREQRLRKTGGIIIKEGKGRVVVVNGQKKISDEEILDRIAYLKDATKANIELRRGEWKFGITKVPSDANAAIFLVDDPGLPMSLVAIESCWGVMNVSSIDAGQRFKRQFMRVTTATLAAGSSQYSGSVMKTVVKPEDLDKLMTDQLTVDAVQGMNRHLEDIGVTRSKIASYRMACAQGWAPAPTNDIQRAVWDEVHAIPTKPIKIEYNEKRDKGK